MRGLGGCLCAWALLAVWPGCGGSDDRCRGVVCDQPPASACLDADTLRTFTSSGQCQPDTGQCSYTPAEQACEFGCGQDRCLEQDPCQGVVCDDPPSNTCLDADRLQVYAAVGACAPEDGTCGYPWDARVCERGCADGACLDQDACQGVECDSPPPDTCQDADTLLEYADLGVCDSATGRCQYTPSPRVCAAGCRAGICLEPPPVWGWISVLELNEATLNAPWTWLSGVRAYFARAPHCRNFPEHWLEACGPPLATEGACALYGSDWQDPWRCEPACDLDTQECVDVDALPTCRDLPAAWDVGAIQVTGLAAPVSLSADELGRYSAGSLPAELFGAGDAIQVQTGGGALAPLSLQGVGVAHLELGSASLPLVRGQPAQVTWTPADPDSRVQVLLEAGPHHPAPPVAAILCDAPDEDGQVELPAALVSTFLDRAYCVCRFSHVTRYRQAILPTQGGEVELRVGSVRPLQLERR